MCTRVCVCACNSVGPSTGVLRLITGPFVLPQLTWSGTVTGSGPLTILNANASASAVLRMTDATTVELRGTLRGTLESQTQQTTWFLNGCTVPAQLSILGQSVTT